MGMYLNQPKSQRQLKNTKAIYAYSSRHARHSRLAHILISSLWIILIMSAEIGTIIDSNSAASESFF